MNTHGARLSPWRAWWPLALVGLLLAASLTEAQTRAAARRQARRETCQLRQDQREQRDEVVSFIQKTFPEKAKRLEELRRKDPAEFARRRQELVGEVRRLIELRDLDPEFFRLQVDEMKLRDEVVRLAREARRAKDAVRRREAEERLRKTVERSFELRQKIKEAELRDLRLRVNDLEESLKRRANRRGALVEERMEELLQGGREEW